MSNGQTKYWCGTLNNWTEEEEEAARAVCTEHAAYGIIGREVGDGGVRHLQCYFEFINRKRLLQLKRLLGERWHLERRNGSGLEASTYCKKDEDYWEHGELTKSLQGKRTDLEEVREKLLADKEVVVADEFFSTWVKYQRSFKRYKDMKCIPIMRPDLVVVYIWGNPGTGKTRIAREVGIEKGGVWFASDTELKWFDGYDQEPCVILDDYRGGASDSWILRVLDIYELRVPVKGGFVAWNPAYIYITSNLEVINLHSSVQAAFRRRIKKVFHISDALDFSNDQNILRIKSYLD